MTIRKRFHQEWIYKCPDAVLTCSILKCRDDTFIAFGGHDKKLYIMDRNRNLLDQVVFDGWCRCSYSKDITGDGCDELLVGSGDGSCLVLNYDQEKKKLINLKHYKSKEKINCCIAGDLYGKGVINLIFGSEDKTLIIFNTLNSTTPETTLYFDSWVMNVDIGFFKLPDFSEQILGLIVGTKNGYLYFITFFNEKPDILWQKNLYSQINGIKIGDVSNDGYNEIICCTNDSYIKILDGIGNKLQYISIEKSRPISLLIDDIDGDNANEIIIGCADGSLRVYENPKENSLDFNLKWKTKTRTSIKNICSFNINDEEFNTILFGGYDRTIRKIYDFEWNQKPKLNIPERKIPEQKQIKKLEGVENLEIPMNLREYILYFMKNQKILVSLEIIMKELLNIGYSKNEINDELDLLKNNNLLKFQKYNNPIWQINEDTLITDENHIKTIEISKSINQESEIREDAEKKLSLKENIIEYLKINKIISSKAEIIKNISKLGFSENKIEQELKLMKEKGIIMYSRSTPRGWSLVS